MELIDVTLRDGLQTTPPISLAHKLLLLEKLFACQFARYEVTSFVSPKWVAQFADQVEFSEALFRNSNPLPPLMCFVPNVRGCDNALNFPYPWISCVVATSDAFNQKNLNAPTDEVIATLGQIREKTLKQNRKLRIYLSTAFGCPYSGSIDRKVTQSVIKKIVQLCPDEIALSDTIGVGIPSQLPILVEDLGNYPRAQLALHVHNTYGLASSLVYESLKLGITKWDGSLGGLGGCPYAKGATGNVAIEDLAFMLFRSHQEKTDFKWIEIEKTVLMLNQINLIPSGSLASILKQGGGWYGIKRGH